MTWCDGCNRPEQTTDHYNDDTQHLEYLCTPCWHNATYWDSIRRKTQEPAA